MNLRQAVPGSYNIGRKHKQKTAGAIICSRNVLWHRKYIQGFILVYAWATSLVMSANAEAISQQLYLKVESNSSQKTKELPAALDLVSSKTDERSASTKNTSNTETALSVEKVLSLLEEARLLREAGKLVQALDYLDMASHIVEQLKEPDSVKEFASIAIYMSRFNTLMILKRYEDAASAIERVLRFVEKLPITEMIRKDSSFLGTAPYSAYYKAATASKYVDIKKASVFLDKGFSLLQSSTFRNKAESEEVYLEYADFFARLGQHQKSIEIYSMLAERYVNNKELSESSKYAGLLSSLADLHMIDGNIGYAELLLQGAKRIYEKNAYIYKYEHQWSKLYLLRVQSKITEALAVAEDIEKAAREEDNRAQYLRALSTQVAFAERLQDSNKLSLIYNKIGKLPKNYFNDELVASYPHDFVIIFNALSQSYLSAGLIDEARTTLDLALEIAFREFGIGNFLTIKSLLLLAQTDEYLDDKRARDLYRRLAEISYENGLLIQAVDSLSRLSSLEAKAGNAEQAIYEGKAHAKVYLELLIDILPNLSRRDRIDTVGSYNSDVLHTLSTLHQTAVEAGLWAAINERGLLNHVELRQRRLVVEDKQKQLTKRLSELSEISSKGDFSTRVATSEQIRNAELLLNQLTPYKPNRKFFEIKDFLDSLPGDSTYVHIVRYGKQDFLSKSSSIDSYGAYISSAQGSYFVEIGKGNDIDSAISAARVSLSDNLSDSRLKLYKVYELAVQPWLKRIKPNSKIYVSLDSEMHTMPIGSLFVTSTGEQVLADLYTVRLISSPRDHIIDYSARAVPARSKSVVFADPIYETNAIAGANLTRDVQVMNDNQAKLRSWAQLKYAGAEGALISSTIKSSLYARERASEENLKAVRSPLVLHIAAHAFFDPILTSGGASKSGDAQSMNMYRETEHYLYGSGIALSATKGSNKQPYGDGILTAAEASGLNLAETELVVLSACSTGDGVSTSGLGVFGLYRSFIEAGAKSVLTSLWKVDDESTAEFMALFYTFVKDGKSKTEAVRLAQLGFREGSVGSGKWKDPYYWAAWQLVGDWRPIQGL